MPDTDQTPEVKPRNRKAATARKTVRKPAARDAILETPSKNTQASEARTAKSRQPTRKPEIEEAPETPTNREIETPVPMAAPAHSTVSRDTTPHMSGRLGSRLTGTHAALPAQSGSHARREAEDGGGEDEVNFKPRPPQQQPTFLQRGLHEAKLQVAHLMAELSAGRIPWQIGAATAAVALLWLLLACASAARDSRQANNRITALAGAVAEGQNQIVQLRAQMMDASEIATTTVATSQKQLREATDSLQSQVLHAQLAAKQLQDRYDAQQAHWQAVLQDLQMQHSTQQQQQWERELSQMQAAAATEAVVSGDDGVTSEGQWQRIREGTFLHVRRVLDSYAADRTGRPDFALASAGGGIVGHSMIASEAQPRWVVLWQRVAAWMPYVEFVHPSADQMVLSPVGQPGQCLSLSGSSGHVDIRLRARTYVDAVTLEHVPRSIAFDESSAPREVRVSASDGAPSRGGTNITQLLTAQYDMNNSPVQTFRVKAPHACDHIRLQVMSNHGNTRYTCLYRVRVHGHPTN